jgi:hypothetical protein
MFDPQIASNKENCGKNGKLHFAKMPEIFFGVRKAASCH